LIRCIRCKAVMLENPQETFNVSNYDYYKERLGFSKDQLYSALTGKRYTALLLGLNKYRTYNRLLDIGCGEGQFLLKAGELKWKAAGTEIAPYAVMIARRMGLEVAETDFLDLQVEKGSLDIVTMFEVLEHLTRPLEYLNKVNQSLRIGGALIITTPNFDSLTRRVLNERWRAINSEHLFYFTPSSLKRMLETCGFRQVAVRVKNISLPELFTLFNKDTQKMRERTQDLRCALEQNAVLGACKSMLNLLLNMTGSGETIDCIFEKVSEPL